MNPNKMSLNKWTRKIFMLQIEDIEANNKIKKLKFAKLFGWGVNCFVRQYLIPSSKKSFICKALGIPHYKNSNRVKAGFAASRNHPITRVQFKQEPHGEDKNDEAISEYSDFSQGQI